MTPGLSPRTPPKPPPCAGFLKALRVFYVPALAIGAFSCFVLWLGMYLILCMPLYLLTRLERRLMPEEIGFEQIGSGGWNLVTPFLLLLELPLALLSYAMHANMKYLTGPMLALMKETTSFGWSDFNSRLAAQERWNTLISVYLCGGPRWNTHTNVHKWTIPVESHRAKFEVENVRKPGYSWQAVFYDYNMKTLTSQPAVPKGPKWLPVTVKTDPSLPKSVTLLTRPYLFDDCREARIPQLKLNGKLLDGKGDNTFTSDKLAFNRKLRAKQNIWYLAWQWYSYPLLRARHLLPASLVRSIYLPVLNPNTQWLYGVVYENYALTISVRLPALVDHLVFITVYSRASLPTLSSIRISHVVETLPVSGEDGFWAVRIVRKDGAPTKPALGNSVKVSMAYVPPSDDDLISTRDDLSDASAMV